jgi:hypothetical protein
MEKDFLDHLNGKRHLKGLAKYEAKRMNEKKHILLDSTDTEVKIYF